MACFSSCDDAELAKKLDGTWSTSHNLKDDEGTPYTEESNIKFKYVDSNDKDGGTFIEKTIDKIEVEESIIKAGFTSEVTISGEWEIIWGNLYMTYNPQSLNVEIKDVRYKLSDDVNPIVALAYLGEISNNITWLQDIIYTKIFVKKLRKQIYKEMYEYYTSSNEEDENNTTFYFPDIKIGSNDMSYETDDLGRVVYKRVK